MIDLWLAVAIVLLVAGVAGSVVPGVPGALVSLIGVYCYWWSTGFGEPGALFVAVATLVGLLALVLSYLGSALSAKVGGASTTTVIAAAVVGLLLLLVSGPPGALLGVVLTVFAIEVYRGAEMEAGLRTALITAVGMLASTVVEILLTGSILVAFLLVVFL